MISCRFLVGSFAFCFLWIWMFSGNSQKSKRAINVKSNTVEITNTLSNFLVFDLPRDESQWFSFAKEAKNFASASFEVIPVATKVEIIFAIFYKPDSESAIKFHIQWDEKNVFLVVNNNTRFNADFSSKFTVDIREIGTVLRIQICSNNNNCAWDYLPIFSLKALQFNHFFISLPIKNSALIRNFKIQKFLASPNSVKYFPLLTGGCCYHENFPRIKSMEMTFFLQQFKRNESNHMFCTFLASGENASETLLTLQWKTFPTIFDFIFNTSAMSIPYSDITNDWLTLYLYPDYAKNLLTIKSDNQNDLIVPYSFEELQAIAIKFGVVVLINSEHGSFKHSSNTSIITTEDPNDIFHMDFQKTAYMIAFRGINYPLQARIESGLAGYNINVTQNNRTSTIFFNNRTASIRHDLSNPRPEIEILLGKDILQMFTSDGKNVNIESGISPSFFASVTVFHKKDLIGKIQVNTVALIDK